MTTAPMALVIFGMALLSLGRKSPVLDTGRTVCVRNYWGENVTVIQDDSLGHRLEFGRLKPYELRCGVWEFRHKGRLLYVVGRDTLAGRWP